ncbi:MAG: hypothetical protein ACOX5C_08975 [Acutalibacteraceae bacterium]|jgi:hypothetical protein
MNDNGSKGPSSKDIFEMQREAEERVRRIQQQAKRAAEQLNEELSGEKKTPPASSLSPLPGEKKTPPASSLSPLPVRESVSLSASEDLKRYRVSYRNGFIGRNYPEAFEDREEDTEPQDEGPERRGDGELRERDIYSEAQSVHVSVPSRPGSRRVSDFLSPEDREKEFRKKHYISMPTEIPDRYRYVVPGKKAGDRADLRDKPMHKRGGAESREESEADRRQPLDLPDRDRDSVDFSLGQSKGIASLAGALNLNANALDSDEMLLLTLILLLAEEGADIGLIIALMYILV